MCGRLRIHARQYDEPHGVLCVHAAELRGARFVLPRGAHTLSHRLRHCAPSDAIKLSRESDNRRCGLPRHQTANNRLALRTDGRHIHGRYRHGAGPLEGHLGEAELALHAHHLGIDWCRRGRGTIPSGVQHQRSAGTRGLPAFPICARVPAFCLDACNAQSDFGDSSALARVVGLPLTLHLTGPWKLRPRSTQKICHPKCCHSSRRSPRFHIPRPSIWKSSRK